MDANEQTKISLIGKDINYIQKDIAEIKQSMKDLTNVYATQIALEEVSKEVKQLRDSSNLWRWVSPTLSSAITAAVTFLLLFYLQHLPK